MSQSMEDYTPHFGAQFRDSLPNRYAYSSSVDEQSHSRSLPRSIIPGLLFRGLSDQSSYSERSISSSTGEILRIQTPSISLGNYVEEPGEIDYGLSAASRGPRFRSVLLDLCHGLPIARREKQDFTELRSSGGIGGLKKSVPAQDGGPSRRVDERSRRAGKTVSDAPSGTSQRPYPKIPSLSVPKASADPLEEQDSPDKSASSMVVNLQEPSIETASSTARSSLGGRGHELVETPSPVVLSLPENTLDRSKSKASQCSRSISSIDVSPLNERLEKLDIQDGLCGESTCPLSGPSSVSRRSLVRQAPASQGTSQASPQGGPSFKSGSTKESDQPAYQRPKHDSEPDAEESGDEGDPRKPNKHELVSKMPTESLLVCPFVKNLNFLMKNQGECAKCHTVRIKSVSSLTQHVERKHHYCTRCGLYFPNSPKANDCNSNGGCCKCKGENDKKRKRKERETGNPTDRWNSLYKMLFPGEPCPSASPVDAVEISRALVLGEIMKGMPPYLKMQLHSLLKAHLESRQLQALETFLGPFSPINAGGMGERSDVNADKSLEQSTQDAPAAEFLGKPYADSGSIASQPYQWPNETNSWMPPVGTWDQCGQVANTSVPPRQHSSQVIEHAFMPMPTTSGYSNPYVGYGNTNPVNPMTTQYASGYDNMNQEANYTHQTGPHPPRMNRAPAWNSPLHQTPRSLDSAKMPLVPGNQPNDFAVAPEAPTFEQGVALPNNNPYYTNPFSIPQLEPWPQGFLPGGFQSESEDNRRGSWMDGRKRSK